MTEKWETLRSSLIISKESTLICSEQAIEQAEKDLGFKFPAGYKEYCQIFGSGELGRGNMLDGINIYCPCCPQTRGDIRDTGYNLVGLKIDLESSGLEESDDIGKLPFHLLENGYAFGGTACSDTFFWDLASLGDDESYDIYWKADEDVENISLVGRDFFEFIDKFCLGNGLKIIFGEDFSEENGERFFTPFENHKSRPKNTEFSAFDESTWELILATLQRHQVTLESVAVKITCGYDAENKVQADCLQNAWSQDSFAEIELIEPSKRANIPRLVNVSVLVRELRSELVEEIEAKMKTIGIACGCPITSYGSEITRTDLP